MSKLEVIRKALETRRDAGDTRVLCKEGKSFGEGYTGGTIYNAHTVDYVVAPTIPTYSLSKLNAWFESLIPNYPSLSPVDEDKFKRYNPNDLMLGFLRFDEEGLGYTNTITTRIVRITDEEFLQGLKEFKDGLRIRTEEIKNVWLGRKIIIYGCPNEKIAKGVLNGEIKSMCHLPKIEN